MKLRRNVTIDRAGRVVFKLRGDEFMYSSPAGHRTAQGTALPRV
jgi:hypothetical protein